MRNFGLFYFIPLFCSLLLIGSCQNKKPDWSPSYSPLMTRWSSDVSPENAWPEYPRPQMVRSEWKNLNGLWDYAIVPVDSNFVHSDGKILVPFPPESALSGVGRVVGDSNKIYYRREFVIPEKWNGKNMLLL